ncbi:hypothetical protein JTB14_022998 [Gonioctena quinquepunctata]|nr:hypothetical protein JTB14_022998 [Gonioctena quinquepunctata]
MINFVKQIGELNKSNVYIKSPDLVNETLKKIINGSCDRLQIVSDFDKTITKQHENGTTLSSFGMFSKCPSVTEEHVRITNNLVKKYAPIEVDPNVPYGEKTKLMQEWWSLSEDSLKGLKVGKEEIERVCSQLGPSLRDGTNEFFRSLHRANVPLLVFSAGLGDTVVALLKHWGVLLPNVEVASNFLKYDKEGTILGFRDALIHVLNKNEYAIKGTEFHDKVADRDNVILLGDSLGDANMVEGMDHLSSVLKIGFLYERSEEALPSYMDTFDIVLRDDQSMDVPRAIFNLIEASNTGCPELVGTTEDLLAPEAVLNLICCKCREDVAMSGVTSTLEEDFDDSDDPNVINLEETDHSVQRTNTEHLVHKDQNTVFAGRLIRSQASSSEADQDEQPSTKERSRVD